MKSTKYLNIMQKDSRYRNRYNPLKFLLQGQSVLKGFEEQRNQEEIEKIVEEELYEDFSIGGHQDFNYLLNEITTETDFNKDENREKDIKLCSVFIDLRNFTKRALFVNEENGESIQEIADLKQEAISTWIKLARYYQGHIHSITGDGLMILFGGKKEVDLDEWTVGARAFLLAIRVLESNDILNEYLKDKLAEKGLETKNIHNLLDIKVGIEHSPNTLMNAQGVIVNSKAVGEIKATSFEIDFSAKLLSYFGAIREKLDISPKYGRLVMLGEKYIELMEFSDDISINKHSESYKRQMFGKELSRSIHYLDCLDYKNNILTLEDVAGLCDVYVSSKEAKQENIKVLKESGTIQHG